MESIIKKFEHLMLWAHDQSCQAIDKNRVFGGVSALTDIVAAF